MATFHSLKRVFFPKPIVFLSSNYLEFQEGREAISRELANDYKVIMMEADTIQAPPGENSIRCTDKKVVLIIGKRLRSELTAGLYFWFLKLSDIFSTKHAAFNAAWAENVPSLVRGYGIGKEFCRDRT